jgi:hypothetical protein
VSRVVAVVLGPHDVGGIGIAVVIGVLGFGGGTLIRGIAELLKAVIDIAVNTSAMPEQDKQKAKAA